MVQLYDLLAEVTEEVDEDALQNFFWFEEPEEGKKENGSGRNRENRTLFP